MRRALPLMAALALAAAGCGSDNDTDKGSSGSKASPGGPAPAALLGTYTTSLTAADVPPNKPAELTEDDPSHWKLAIANTGGSGSGRAFTITSPEHGPFESPEFAVSGNTITLVHEQCDVDESEHDNQYRYTLSGKTLTFTTVKDSCPDKVVETILTAHPWKKSH